MKKYTFQEEVNLLGSLEKWEELQETAWRIANLLKPKCTTIQQAEIALGIAEKMLKQAPIFFIDNSEKSQ